MNNQKINQDEYLKDRLDHQIDWYDNKSLKNQKWFKRLQVIVIISAAVIPFLAGYIDDHSFYLKIVIGLLGLVIAAITAVLSLYHFQENWIEYRTTCETLRHEKYLFLTRSVPYNCKEPFLLLVERVEGLISKENTNWQNYMKKSKKGNEKC